MKTKKKQMEHFFSQIQVKTKKKKKRSSSKIEHFFPQIQVKTKKKKKTSSPTIEHFFPQIYAQMNTDSNYWGDADVDHSQTIRGNTAKLLGGIYPPSPLLFRHPWVSLNKSTHDTNVDSKTNNSVYPFFDVSIQFVCLQE